MSTIFFLQKSKKSLKNSKMVKKSKNLEKSQNLSNNHFFFWKPENFESNIFFAKKRRRNAILLVLPIEEISFRPELSSPPCFWFQAGWSERYKGWRTKDGEQRTEILMSNIGFLQDYVERGNRQRFQTDKAKTKNMEILKVWLIMRD